MRPSADPLICNETVEPEAYPVTAGSEPVPTGVVPVIVVVHDDCPHVVVAVDDGSAAFSDAQPARAISATIIKPWNFITDLPNLLTPLSARLVPRAIFRVPAFYVAKAIGKFKTCLKVRHRDRNRR